MSGSEGARSTRSSTRRSKIDKHSAAKHYPYDTYNATHGLQSDRERRQRGGADEAAVAALNNINNHNEDEPLVAAAGVNNDVGQEEPSAGLPRDMQTWKRSSSY